jgi:hypothetical protein
MIPNFSFVATQQYLYIGGVVLALSGQDLFLKNGDAR